MLNEKLTATRAGIDVRWHFVEDSRGGWRAAQPCDPRAQIPSVVSLRFAPVDTPAM